MKTDHQARRRILFWKKTTRRIAKRRFRLVVFDFKVVHHRERYYCAATASSRLPYCCRGLPESRGETQTPETTFWHLFRQTNMRAKYGLHREWRQSRAVASRQENEGAMSEQRAVSVSHKRTWKEWFDSREWGWTAMQKSTDWWTNITRSPRLLQKTIIYHDHCPTISGPSGMGSMYSVQQKTQFWPYMGSGQHEFVFNWNSSR